MAKVLIAGCGYVGAALGQRLLRNGNTVWGLRRQTGELPRGIRPITADLGNVADLRKQIPGGLDYVFYTAGAASFSDAAYEAAYVTGLRNLVQVLEETRQRPRRVLFTSSSGVYAQDGGEWVDEESPACPVRFSGQRLLEGEDVLRGSEFPTVVVRLGGIYGPGRTRLLDQVREGTARCIEGRDIYLNLIHRDDCAGILHHLMLLGSPEPLYLAVDCEPVGRNELLRWLAAEYGAPEPPVVSVDPETEPQRGGNRRFRNTRLTASGYRFQFPTFRDGFKRGIGVRPGFGTVVSIPEGGGAI